MLERHFSILAFAFLLTNMLGAAFDIQVVEPSPVASKVSQSYSASQLAVKDAGNLAPNPSFEDGRASPLDWSYYDYHDETMFLWDNISSCTGSYSIGIANMSQPHTVYAWITEKAIPVDPRRSYFFSVWYKWIGVPSLLQDAEISVSQRDENGVDIGGFGLVLTFYDDGEWHNGLLRCDNFSLSTVSVVLELQHIFRQNASEAYVRFDNVFFGRAPVHNIDSGLDYATIQGAINAAETLDGHTVFVEAGTYHENVVLNKTVSLIGQDTETTVIEAEAAIGVIGVFASNVTIRNFTIRGGRTGVDVVFSYHVTIENNMIIQDSGGIYLWSSNSCKIACNEIIGGGDDGIYSYLSEDNEIRDNNVTGHRYGIFLCESKNNTVMHNVIASNRAWGIQVWGLQGEGNVLAYNNVSGNGFGTEYPIDGIYIDLSSRNIIQNNRITGNARDGMTISESNDNIIQANTFSNSSGRAGLLLWSSRNNTVTDNCFTDNSYGIYLGGTSNSTFYHNNFVANTQQVFCHSGTEINVFDNDYPSGGNYWSNYIGVDLCNGPYQNITGSDGIGDTPYEIDVNNKDNYPLMSLWLPPDIRIAYLKFSRTIVGQGFPVSMNLTLENEGGKTENFSVTIHANSTLLHSTSFTLNAASSSLLTFTWNTSSAVKGNYTVIAYADTVLGEIDTADNIMRGWIIVTISGDLNGDYTVDISDAILLAHSFGLARILPFWDPDPDINGDGIVDIIDAILVASNFGKSDA